MAVLLILVATCGCTGTSMRAQLTYSRQGELRFSSRSVNECLEPDSDVWSWSSCCPNAFVITTEAGGLGHRMSALAMGIALAQQVNATVIIDDSLEDMGRLQDKLAYPFLRRLFNLYSFATSNEMGFVKGQDLSVPALAGRKLAYVPTAHVMEAVQRAKEGCGQIFELPTGHAFACPQLDEDRLYYCIRRGIDGAYEKGNEVLAPLYQEGLYARYPLHLFKASVEASSRTAVVVWHIRNDDIKLHPGDTSFWRELVSSVVSSVGGTPAHHYVMSQHEIKPNDASFGFLYNIQGWKWKGLHAIAVDVAMYHMAAADILVHCGSSFSLAAGLVAHNTQVSLFPMPKESQTRLDGPWRTYWMKNNIEVQGDGRIDPASSALLTARLADRLAAVPSLQH